MSEKRLKITREEYEKLKQVLRKELIEELESEIEFSDFDTDGEDLWDIPAVDSKAVIKVSPVVEKHTGTPIDSSWIRCGGYESVPDAVEHIMEQLELEFDKD